MVYFTSINRTHGTNLNLFLNPFVVSVWFDPKYRTVSTILVIKINRLALESFLFWPFTRL